MLAAKFTDEYVRRRVLRAREEWKGISAIYQRIEWSDVEREFLEEQKKLQAQLDKVRHVGLTSLDKETALALVRPLYLELVEQGALAETKATKIYKEMQWLQMRNPLPLLAIEHAREELHKQKRQMDDVCARGRMLLNLQRRWTSGEREPKRVGHVSERVQRRLNLIDEQREWKDGVCVKTKRVLVRLQQIKDSRSDLKIMRDKFWFLQRVHACGGEMCQRDVQHLLFHLDSKIDDSEILQSEEDS